MIFLGSLRYSNEQINYIFSLKTLMLSILCFDALLSSKICFFAHNLSEIFVTSNLLNLTQIYKQG